MKKIAISLLFGVIFSFVLMGWFRTHFELPTEEYVDIGQGRRIFIECLGDGSPTVVLIAGHRDRGDAAWARSLTNRFDASLFSEVSKLTKVCFYDRPGTIRDEESGFDKSRSDPIPQPTTAGAASDDLKKALTGIPPPYVLVGHSAGGLIARLYTSAYPEDVSGLVLVDALSERLYDNLTHDELMLYEKMNAVTKKYEGHKDYETMDFIKSFQEIRKAALIGNTPAIILTADQPPDFESLLKEGLLPPETPPDFGKKLWAAQIDAQNNLASLFPSGEHITNTRSGHYIQIEQPRLVTEAIHKMIKRINGN